MKKIILLFVSVIFLLVSCNDNKGINVPTSDSINEIKVEKLFVVDGITVYRFYDGGVNPTALHYGAMSDDVWLVTRGDGTQRIEVLYECYEKIEWLDFDELK